MSDCDKGDGTLAFNARLTFFAFDVYQIRLQAKKCHPSSFLINHTINPEISDCDKGDGIFTSI